MKRREVLDVCSYEFPYLGEGSLRGEGAAGAIDSGLREAMETLVSKRSVWSRAFSEVALSNEVKIVRGESEGESVRECGSAAWNGRGGLREALEL